MGSKSRRKGCVGEREAAAELRRLRLAPEAHRGRQYCGGSDSPDIGKGIPGCHIEVKRCESLSLYKAVEQAKADAGEKVPLVLHRRNHKPWLAVVELDSLAALAVQVYLTLAQE